MVTWSLGCWGAYRVSRWWGGGVPLKQKIRSLLLRTQSCQRCPHLSSELFRPCALCLLRWILLSQFLPFWFIQHGFLFLLLLFGGVVFVLFLFFYSVLASISVFMALSTVLYSINSPDSSPFSDSVLPVLSVPYWSFQFNVCLWKSPSALI